LAAESLESRGQSTLMVMEAVRWGMFCFDKCRQYGRFIF